LKDSIVTGHPYTRATTYSNMYGGVLYVVIVVEWRMAMRLGWDRLRPTIMRSWWPLLPPGRNKKHCSLTHYDLLHVVMHVNETLNGIIYRMRLNGTPFSFLPSLILPVAPSLLVIFTPFSKNPISPQKTP